AAIERVEHVGVLTDAQEVGPRRRLDAHDRRTVFGEVPRGDRPRRPRPELQDLRPAPRPAVRLCGSNRSYAPVITGRTGGGDVEVGPLAGGAVRVEEVAGRELGGR